MGDKIKFNAYVKLSNTFDKEYIEAIGKYEAIEKKFSNIENEDFTIDSIHINEDSSEWSKYISYLFNWAITHQNEEYDKMSPLNFEEWSKEEYSSDEDDEWYSFITVGQYERYSKGEEKLEDGFFICNTGIEIVGIYINAENKIEDEFNNIEECIEALNNWR